MSCFPILCFYRLCYQRQKFPSPLGAPPVSRGAQIVLSLSSLSTAPLLVLCISGSAPQAPSALITAATTSHRRLMWEDTRMESTLLQRNLNQTCSLTLLFLTYVVQLLYEAQFAAARQFPNLTNLNTLYSHKASLTRNKDQLRSFWDPLRLCIQKVPWIRKWLNLDEIWRSCICVLLFLAELPSFVWIIIQK